MTLSDSVLILMVLTFLPFNEGIIAKSPRWKKLSDSLEVGVTKTVSWRANADVASELNVVARYFKHASVASIVAIFIAVLIKSQPLIAWLSGVFIVVFFAWFSFEWTFNHRQAIKQFAPTIGYSLIVPWALLMLDYYKPEAGLMLAIGEPLLVLPIHPITPFQISFTLFLFILALFSIYYLFCWLIFSPFAYLVLAGLKLSQTISRVLVKRFSRNLLSDLSVLVQLSGTVYLYFIGRAG